MPKNNFDLDRMEEIVISIKRTPSTSNLKLLENELNKFISESKCMGVIYTKNNDKLFFGAKIDLVLSDSDIKKIMLDDCIVKINKYYLELDSKLFEDLNLSGKELTAIILHEVGHCVISGTNINELRKVLDYYYMKNDTNVERATVEAYADVLKYGIADAILKLNSIFYKSDPEEIAADTFVHACGYSPYLISAFNKILSNGSNINKGTPKLAVLEWSLMLYKNIHMRRIPALKLLDRVSSLTGSEIERRNAKNLINFLHHVDSINIEEGTFLESNKESMFSKLKRNGLKSIENDLYEFQVRVRNAETESDTFYTLKQINSRIAVLDDYLYELGDNDEREYEKWYKVLCKYRALREDLAKNKVYNHKQYGLYFDYNQMNMNYGF